MVGLNNKHKITITLKEMYLKRSKLIVEALLVTLTPTLVILLGMAIASFILWENCFIWLDGWYSIFRLLYILFSLISICIAIAKTREGFKELYYTYKVEEK
jgi:hypothetical protein